MSQQKLHWQVDWKIGIDGSEPKEPKLAICGQMWPLFAMQKSDVTCIRCKKRLEKQETVKP